MSPSPQWDSEFLLLNDFYILKGNMRTIFFITFVLTALFLTSCGNKGDNAERKDLETKMNTIAEKYVKLILAIGEHDPDYVDAYYGPEEWKSAAGNITPGDSLSIQSLYDTSDELLDSLDALGSYNADELETLRFRYLYKQILSARSKLFLLAGGEYSFDEEAQALYDANVPSYSEQHFQNTIDSLDKILPGSGIISQRLDNFRKNFIIPPAKLDTVFQAAIKESRERTKKYIKLPPDESFTIEYVKNQPWSGYNWYKGNSYSLIQINVDLPIYIDRAVDLAAHEGYPGHHVYNLLLERNLYRQRGWVEFSVYPLFSPQSLIAEGTANYGIEMAFPGGERIKFEKEVLFPLAGLDSSEADLYYNVQALTGQLNYAGNEAARNYLNGEWSREETLRWLEKYSLASKERAEQKIKFTEKYRSYVINYNLGQDMVREYILQNGGNPGNPDRRWSLFENLISTPQTPSGLVRGADK
jgi:hypothetical protein